MNNKNLIQVVVIVIAFSGAGYVLYQGGLFGSHAGTSAALTAAAAKPEDILPYGEILSSSTDFSKVIIPSRFQYNQILYPVLDPQKDVGIPVTNLLPPAVSP